MNFKPKRPEGADFHKCSACDGTGLVYDALAFEHVECPVCDGLGEWFE